MPTLTRTFDLLAWLLHVSSRFPRIHRFTLTQRLLDAAFDLRERLEAAQLRRGRARMVDMCWRVEQALYLMRRYGPAYGDG